MRLSENTSNTGPLCFQKHILLCGRRRSGRSTLIHTLLQNVTVPVFGYETITMGTRPDGWHEIYLFPYGTENPQKREENHVADCNTKERVICTAIFDTLGVQLLCAPIQGILVMDEIGFMESGAENFCRTILKRLDGDTPVIRAKMGPGSNLIDRSREVTVVPMFAPMITPTDWARVSNWAFTKPTTITVVAPEDWMTAVTQMPVSMAITRFRVIKVKKPFYFAEGEGYVDGRLCVKAEFSFAIV